MAFRRSSVRSRPAPPRNKDLYKEAAWILLRRLFFLHVLLSLILSESAHRLPEQAPAPNNKRPRGISLGAFVIAAALTEPISTVAFYGSLPVRH